MPLEKPWHEPFEKLLKELTAARGGEIIRPKEHSGPGTSRVVPADMYLYPRWKGEQELYPVFMEIAECPVGGMTMLDAGDNVEYLNISVTSVTRCEALMVRHETFFDRVRKKLHLAKEFQTRDVRFNSEYFLTPKSREDEQALQDSNVRQHLMGLEPFEVVYIGAKSLQWSQEVKAAEQLECKRVEEVMSHLTALATALSK